MSISLALNALHGYLQGLWKTPFSKSRTDPNANFYPKGKKNPPVKVAMMQSEPDAKFKYLVAKDIGARMLELPYKGNKLSMILILPENEEDQGALEKIEANLAAFNWSRISK